MNIKQMTQEQKCKFLTLVIGKCWHDIKSIFAMNRKCQKCKKVIYFEYCEGEECYGSLMDAPFNMNYFTPSGFWEVWEWAKEQNWWGNFVWVFLLSQDIGNVINYRTFSDTLAQFLIESKGEWGWVECKEYKCELGEKIIISCPQNIRTALNWELHKGRCNGKLKHPALLYLESLEKGEEKWQE